MDIKINKKKFKVLLLEGLHNVAIENFKNQLYDVESLPNSLNTEQLKEKIKDIDILGIRSKTQITKDILLCANKLKVIGCYCIGTDQIDLEVAESLGIIVFNSPFANSRSVAELVIGEIIMLSRKIFDNSNNVHSGIWNKSSVGCYEIRGKTLGIIGYGNVGTQVSLLAESLSMNVQYYDIEDKLPLGNAKVCKDMDTLLKTSDYITLHVPKTDQTKNMINKRELELMRKGTYLLNLSRGTVINMEDLLESLKKEHIAGCAIDVYPNEPKENIINFTSILQNMPNTILTPHIGGSTLEAQEAIGKEVTQKIIKYLKDGNSHNSVNFPQILPPKGNIESHRLLNIHNNIPGVLKKINNILENYNISGQWLCTTNKIGYLIVDVDNKVSMDLLYKIKNLDASIKTRLLY